MKKRLWKISMAEKMGVLFSILLCSYYSVLMSNVLHNKTSCFTNIYWKFEDSFPSSLESIKVLHNSNRSEDGVWMYVCNFVYLFLFSCIILSCVSYLFMVNILVLSENFSLPFFHDKYKSVRNTDALARVSNVINDLESKNFLGIAVVKFMLEQILLSRKLVRQGEWNMISWFHVNCVTFSP